MKSKKKSCNDDAHCNDARRSDNRPQYTQDALATPGGRPNHISLTEGSGYPMVDRNRL